MQPEQFEQHRSHLRAVAYRMLGSVSEAEDAVQEAWLRLARADQPAIQNLGGWLTTVTARICLDMLRARAACREEPLEVHVPDPIVAFQAAGPEQQAELADEIGLALLVVLDSLNPAERLAFVLHDLFAVPFNEIAVILDRSPDAAKQLASRARRRLQGAAPPDTDRARQRQVVAAFIAATRAGDFGALLALLHPDVVLRADAGSGPFAPVQADPRRERGRRPGRPVRRNGAPRPPRARQRPTRCGSSTQRPRRRRPRHDHT
jgi:RNA polymerase sigma factor (sigma-70 family)